MDHLGFLSNYLIVIDEGSLSAGARRTGISQPAISQQIATLEEYYGQKLLERSKAGVRPTKAGQVVCKYATQMQEAQHELLAELDILGNSTSGTLTLSTSLVMAELGVADVVYNLRHTTPDLNIVMRVEDRLVDVVRENYDLAIRTGNLGNTDGIVRKIAMIDTILVANPAYLDTHGRPHIWDDMSKLDFIEYSVGRSNGYLPVIKDNIEIEMPVRIGFTANTVNVVLSALANSVGYARMPRALVREHLKDGRLEEVFPKYKIAPKPIHVVYPHRHSLNRRSQLLIDALIDEFKTNNDVHLLHSIKKTETIA
ncbi:LysR family transcriptional regulator [Amylibacter sp. SFDW26]|uniref:substrate binding domain-containing protein n=1 Tax=Amylibacter sp. SFDW26 TaxID=2652722 RepID=UPI001261D569|nr:substrate binding domain-containing protein [Amylibacter sp. SFDW26]KAB7615832.1 LysR family transcriptional regulator [Amylibacter sp. SFDW26]